MVGGRREVVPNPFAMDKGQLALVQTMDCRRCVVRKVYQNKASGECLFC